MADLQKIIEIVFQGNDNVGSSVVSVSKGLDTVADKALDITGPLSSATDFILKVDAALIAMGATMVGVAVNQAGKFQNATSEINTLIDASPEKFDALKSSILDYARESASSLEDITRATYSAISAGTDYEDAISVIAEAEKLAVAGRADLNDTTVILVSTLNAYGKSVADAGEFSNILFAAVQKGQTTLPQLSSALSQVTGVAAAAGVPFEDLAGATAALTAHGVPTSQAVTAVKAALSNIIKPSKAAADASKELGVEFNVQALKAKGLDGLLKELSIATGGNVTEMSKFFGSVEGLNGVMQLTSNSSAKFTEVLGAVRNSAGATAKAYGKMADSFEVTNQNLRNNIEVTLVQVGEKLLAQYGETAKALGKVFAGIGKGVDEDRFDPVLDVINAFGARAQRAMEDIARNLPQALAMVDWDGFADALGSLGGAVASLFKGVDVSTPEGLAKAIDKVVGADEFLVQVTEGIVDGLKPFLEQAANLLDKLLEISPEAQKAGGEILGFAKGLDTLLDFVGPVAGGLDSIGIGLQALAGVSALKTLKGLAGGFGGIKTAVTGASGALLGQVGFLAALGTAIYEIGRWIDLNDKLVPGVDTLGTKIHDWVHGQDEINELLKPVPALVGQASDAVQALDTSTGEAAESRKAMLLTEQELAKAIAPALALIGKSAEQTEELADASKGAAKYTVEIIDGVKTYTQVIGSKTLAQEKDTKATREAADESEKFRLELEKIASNERIQNIEAHVKLETAELEAATAVTIASFESIDNTITSTGNLLSDLFGEFNKADSIRDKWTIEDQIKTENKLREEAAALQGELTQEQIQYLRAKTEALAKGDALIKISGEGLEPELEAFMWRIIERVQVRASDEGAEFLLGI